MDPENRTYSGLESSAAPSSGSSPESPAGWPVESWIELLRTRAREHPDRRAYVFLEDGEEPGAMLDYHELFVRARAVAAALQARELRGERVLLLFENGVEFMTAFLGCLCAGAIAVPVHVPRNQRTAARLAGITADAGAGTLLTTEALRERADWLELPAPAERVAVESIPSSLAASWSEPREPAVGGGTVAFLQYTSGSTASPKGVVVTHANLLHNTWLMARAFQQDEHSTLVSWLPLQHDMGLIGVGLQALAVGAPCYLMAPEAFLMKPVRWLRAISRFRAYTSGAPNFAYELCARKVRLEDEPGLDLSCWRHAFNGSEPVRAGTLARFLAAFAECGLRPETMYPCYGLAESTLFVTGATPPERPVVRSFDAPALDLAGEASEVLPPETAGPGTARSLVGVGRPWCDEQVRIVDPGSGKEVPARHVGEVWVASGSVARGYWRREAETAATFVRPDGDGGPVYLRTGDLGFLHEGELFLTGRLKDLIVIGGRNHHPEDLELTIEQAARHVRPGSCAAFSVDGAEGADGKAGDEHAVVVAEVQPRVAEGAVDPEELARSIVRAVSAEHDLRVHDVVLIQAGTLPKTSSGKVQRHACRDAYLAGRLARLEADRRAG